MGTRYTFLLPRCLGGMVPDPRGRIRFGSRVFHQKNNDILFYQNFSSNRKTEVKYCVGVFFPRSKYRLFPRGDPAGDLFIFPDFPENSGFFGSSIFFRDRSSRTAPLPGFLESLSTGGVRPLVVHANKYLFPSFSPVKYFFLFLFFFLSFRNKSFLSFPGLLEDKYINILFSRRPFIFPRGS